MSNSLDRVRLRTDEIRKYGPTEAAISAVTAVVMASPEDLPLIGIFPTGADDDSDVGDGGISLQMFSGRGGAVVEISATGGFSTGFYADNEMSHEEPISDAAAAGAFFAKAAEVFE